MQKTRRDMQRRTRRNASTIGGGAPDSTIDRALTRIARERVPTTPHAPYPRCAMPVAR